MRYTAKVKKRIFDEIQASPEKREQIMKEHHLSFDELLSWSRHKEKKDFKISRIFKSRNIIHINLLYS